MTEAVGAVLPIQAGGNTCSVLAGAQSGADTLSVAELTARLRQHRHRIAPETVGGFLLDWQDAGIAEQAEPGRWRLTTETLERFGEFGAIEGQVRSATNLIR